MKHRLDNIIKGAKKAVLLRALLIKLGRSSMFAPALLALLLVGGGTLTFASQKSLPGDIFYPVKTLTEKMDLMFAFTPQAQARVSTIQAIRRLEEAEALYAEDRLSNDTKIALASSFSHKSAAAIGHIEGLDGDQYEAGLKILTEFKGNLRAHKDILQSIVAESDSKSFRLPEAVQTVIASIDMPSNSTVVVNDDIVDSANTARREAEQLIEDADKYISANMSKEDKTKLAVGMRSAEEFFANGKKAIDESAYQDAVIQFKQASKQSIENKALAQSYKSAKKYALKPSSAAKKRLEQNAVATTTVSASSQATSTATTTSSAASSTDITASSSSLTSTSTTSVENNSLGSVIGTTTKPLNDLTNNL